MNSNLKTLTRAALLLAMAIVFQTVKVGGQLFTGTGINAVLLIAASVCGIGWAMAIGTLTPLFAIVLGVMKQPAFVIVPFIIAGNALYVTMFHISKKLNKYVAILLAAISKFVLLYVSVSYFLKVPAQLKVVFGLPQLYTALMGGAVALLILRVIDKANK